MNVSGVAKLVAFQGESVLTIGQSYAFVQNGMVSISLDDGVGGTFHEIAIDKSGGSWKKLFKGNGSTYGYLYGCAMTPYLRVQATGGGATFQYQGWYMS